MGREKRKTVKARKREDLQIEIQMPQQSQPTSELPELPNGWTRTTLGDAAVLVRNGVSTAPREADGVPILRISAVRPMSLDAADRRFLPGGTSDYEPFILDPGDLLYTRYNGNPQLVGACAVVPAGIDEVVHPDKLIRVKLDPEAFVPSFVAAASCVGESRAHIESRTRSTAGQAGISGGDLKQMPLPAAPIREQREIADALDSYLTRLDAAVAGLQHVKANLKRYRASVLKAAVEGRLVPTEAELARKEEREYEPASVLLERILTERRRRWEEAEMAKMKAKGKVPKDDGWKAGYVEPSLPNTEGLPDLPEGWCWATADALCDGVASGTTPKNEHIATAADGTPFIKVYNLTFGDSIDFSKGITYIKQAYHDGKMARSITYPGNVLMNIVGPPLGKVSVVPDKYPEWNINQAIVTFRVSDSGFAVLA